MRIIDQIRIKKGQRVKLEGCTRLDLPQFFVDMGYTVGAEIGVYKAAYSATLAKSGLQIFAIDPWRSYARYKHPKGQKRLDFLYEHAKRELEPFDNVRIVRKTSMEAAKDFEDESLDFVYIDANHEFRYIAEDISEWTKKVRIGGTVSGHDYAQAESRWSPIHVKYVVHAYTQCHHIQNWYITSERGINANRTLVPSWFWIKE